MQNKDTVRNRGWYSGKKKNLASELSSDKPVQLISNCKWSAHITIINQNIQQLIWETQLQPNHAPIAQAETPTHYPPRERCYRASPKENREVNAL